MDDKEKLKKYTLQAKKHIDNNEFSDAEYFFKKIVKLNPSSWEAWYGRGLCQKHMKNYAQAIYSFEKVCELNPEFAKGWYNMGFCLSQIEEFEEALFHLNKSIRLNASLLINHLIKAWIHDQMDNKKTAKKIIQHVNNKDPNFEEEIKTKLEDYSSSDYKMALEILNKYNIE